MPLLIASHALHRATAKLTLRFKMWGGQDDVFGVNLISEFSITSS